MTPMPKKKKALLKKAKINGYVIYRILLTILHYLAMNGQNLLVVVVKITLVFENIENQMIGLIIVIILKQNIIILSEILVLVDVVLVYPHQQGIIHAVIHNQMITMGKLVIILILIHIFVVDEEAEEVVLIIVAADIHVQQQYHTQQDMVIIIMDIMVNTVTIITMVSMGHNSLRDPRAQPSTGKPD